MHNCDAHISLYALPGVVVVNEEDVCDEKFARMAWLLMCVCVIVIVYRTVRTSNVCAPDGRAEWVVSTLCVVHGNYKRTSSSSSSNPENCV